MNKTRIVITGMGTVNCLGHNVAESWQKVSQGISGIERISHFNPEQYQSQVAGEVRNWDFSPHYPAHYLKDAKKMDPFVHFAMASVNEAALQAKLAQLVSQDPYRVGVCIGSGIGGLPTQQKNGGNLNARGPRGVSPMYIPAMLGNICAGFVSMVHGIKGPNLATQTACATANHAIAVGAMMIERGMIDSCVVGGTEDSVVEISVAGFSNMRALSTAYNSEPSRASRPYDIGRDGFVIAEGAGVFVIESLESAEKRGATILAEVAGFGMSGDAYDLVQPDPEGRGALYSMRMACKDAGISPSEIDYINAHGTSTALGDVAESKAIFELIEGKQDKINVGSTKSMHGHLLGATAGLEAILCVSAMHHNLVPPNINIDNFDPKVALSPTVINTKPISKDIKIALSNSFGFGGHNSTIVLRKI